MFGSYFIWESFHFSTIYTYDPDNFPPNFNKYQGPIVKLNDVKINLTDEVVLDPPQVDHTGEFLTFRSEMLFLILFLFR